MPPPCTPPQLHADEVKEVEAVGPGGIAALVGTRSTATGDTLVWAKDTQPVLLEGVQVPPPSLHATLPAFYPALVEAVS